jgi:hypothetical protein
MSTNTPRIFGQLKPSDTSTAQVLYTVPANTRAQVTVFVCNQNADIEFFRIALVPAGGSLIAARYIAWDSPLAGNGVFSVSGIGLNQGDSIWVKSDQGNLSFTATGIQLT